MGTSPTPSVRFRFRGRERRAAPGSSLAVALADGRSPLLQRSVRYHRPRAPFCGIGACTQCLVRVNGVPNVRACRTVVREGDVVGTENAWPSPAFDLWGVLDLLFPGGIDSVRGFRRPAFARRLYQRVVRGLAAFGRIPDAPSGAPAAPATLRRTPFLVVGAGGAGRAAAARLVDGGVRPLLLDRGPIEGAPEGVELLPRTAAVFLPSPRPGAAAPFDVLAASDDGAPVRVAAERVLVATGAYDAGLWLANGERPGVLTAEGALALEAAAGRAPFRRGVLFGGGSRAAELLERWDERVEAVVAPGAIEPAVVRAAADRGVPLHPRSLVRGVVGRRRVRAVSLKGRGRGATTRLEADALVLAHRRIPHVQLLFQAGARMRWSARPGAYVPEQERGATSVPGLYVAGEAAGLPDRAAAADAGRRAAERALEGGPAPSDFPAPGPEGPAEMEGYYRELLADGLGGGRWIACACEDIQVGELLDAGARGYRGLEVVKRYTGVGTGLCQGRYCLPEAILVLARSEGRPPPEVGYITQRPPVFPVRLDTLARAPPPEA